MRYSVREASVEDATEICNLLIRSIRENCHEDHHGDEQLLAAWLKDKTPEHMAQWIAADEATTMVCESAGKIVGVCCIGDGGTVYLCYVDPDYKCTGVGKRMLRSMMDKARQQDNTIVNLVSTATARTFYESHGFIFCGATTPCYGIPGYPMSQAVSDYFSRLD